LPLVGTKINYCFLRQKPKKEKPLFDQEQQRILGNIRNQAKKLNKRYLKVLRNDIDFAIKNGKYNK